MSKLPSLLKSDLEIAIRNSTNTHSSNISRDYLGIFVRAAKIDPSAVIPAIDTLISNMNVHRSNTVASLFCLISIADVNNEAKKIIREKFGDETIAYYIEDENKDIANNAKILQQVLNGDLMSSFLKKGDSIPSHITNYGNMNINSSNTVQKLNIETGLDAESKELLEQLKIAIINKDTSKTKKILGFIVDKGFDFVIALIAGKLLK